MLDDALIKLDRFEERPVEYFRSMIKVEYIARELDGISDSELKLSVQSANVYSSNNQERIADVREDFESKFVFVNGGDWKSHLRGL